VAVGCGAGGGDGVELQAAAPGDRADFRSPRRQHTFRKIADLNKPPEDADRIRKWIDLSLRSTRVGVDAVQALRDEELERGERLSKRSLRIARNAGDVVRYWGFQYCA
jgi:hypothetical protein